MLRLALGKNVAKLGLYLENLISGKGEAVLSNILKSSINSTNIEQVNRDIVKMFSLQNVLNQLTILNPNKIIDQVERILTDFELGIGVKLQNDLKLSLYILQFADNFFHCNCVDMTRKNL